MDFLDDIFEFIIELVVEGSVELGSKKKVPMPLRILAIIVMLAIFGFLTMTIFNIGYEFLLEDKTVEAIPFFIIAALMVIAVFYYIRKTYKEHNNKNTEDDKYEIGEVKPSMKKQIITACIATCVWVALGVWIFYFTDLLK